MIDGGFRLIRERPAAVAIWGLLYLVASAAIALAMLPIVRAQMAALGGDPQAVAGAMGATMGQMVLLQLVFMLLFVVLMTAAQRAVLRPAEHGLASLRLGMDELRMLGLTLLLVIGFYVLMVVGGIIVAAFAAGAGLMLGGGGAGIVGVIGFLALLALAIWLEVRLSLAFPLTLLRRRIVIGEAWRLSRGHFWTLFGGYLAIFVMLMVIFLLVSMVTSGSYFFDMLRNNGDPEAMRAAMQAQLERAGEIGPITILGWVLGAAAGALMVALIGGAVASAVRALTADETVADTFA
jgi:hypothetical protein